jgi:ATP-binding cassette, subfamily B, bacterial
LDDDQLEVLARRFDTQHVAAERTLFEAGDAADVFYVATRGQLVVERPGALPGQPRPRLSDGDSFGEIALLRDIPRTATIRTLTPCVLLRLSRRDFLTVVSQNPTLRTRLDAVAAARISDLGSTARRSVRPTPPWTATLDRRGRT